MTKKRLRPLLLPLALAMLLAGCSRPPEAEAPPRAVLVRTLDGAVGTAAAEVYTGDVRARYETDLGFRIGGKIVTRLVDVGAQVKRGQPLARLDPQDAWLAAGAAAAQVAAAEADLALAKAEFDRATGLRAQNFISASALDSRRTSLQAAEARLRQARAEAATANNQAGYTTLEADADGVITSVTAEAGQVVAAGQAVMRLARPGEREVEIYLPESRVGGVAPGAEVEVRSWISPERRYAGTVREVAPAADAATRTYALRVSVPQADDALKLGSTASVAFLRGSAGQMVLPSPAVTQVEGRQVVWLVGEGDVVRRVPVEVASFREDGVVISGGLPQGARVVVVGVHKLIEGQQVRPVAEDAPVALDVRR
ncbi:efflux RND transporter periplasmic adaptor subunit [Azoarcus indigens]|uniref:RND family efflux transporter MFP subunit n=1 Tax=Azoarcus indigens TaxID=29545 RepID=A0A4R6DYS8_9RHOO|nr:efflux RND transporter periplasmic adaptor subunit [Azoarcus indigens]NMG64979.1 efflux RND transporter periplasmic adaptor subunit [Azoarcus indigens]TDN50516.1 RND family efflux transporter MFP subunit [Azoarcus indigens]